MPRESPVEIQNLVWALFTVRSPIAFVAITMLWARWMLNSVWNLMIKIRNRLCCSSVVVIKSDLVNQQVNLSMNIRRTCQLELRFWFVRIFIDNAFQFKLNFSRNKVFQNKVMALKTTHKKTVHCAAFKRLNVLTCLQFKYALVFPNCELV